MLYFLHDVFSEVSEGCTGPLVPEDVSMLRLDASMNNKGGAVAQGHLQ
jgi:hypothetical protein